MKTCTYNFDMRIDQQFNVYLMEVAPRDGGNYIPQIIKYATGVDLVECSIKAAMGDPISVKNNIEQEGFWAYYAVHSLKDGILDEIIIEENVLEKHIIENHIIKEKGDEIKAFTGANTTLGILIMRFDSMEQMLDMMDNSEKWIKIKLKE